MRRAGQVSTCSTRFCGIRFVPLHCLALALPPAPSADPSGLGIEPCLSSCHVDLCFITSLLPPVPGEVHCSTGQAGSVFSWLICICRLETRHMLHWRPCRSSAVRRWLPTAAVRVRIRAACGVSGEQSGTGAGFLRVLRFPLPIIPPISPLS
jgi:hypothetical protein